MSIVVYKQRPEDPFVIVDDVKRKYKHYKHESFKDMVDFTYCPDIFLENYVRRSKIIHRK